MKLLGQDPRRRRQSRDVLGKLAAAGRRAGDKGPDTCSGCTLGCSRGWPGGL